MTAAERIGQLFMGAARVPTTSAADLAVLRRYDVGSVILLGRSQVGVWRTRALADRLQSLKRTTKAGRAGLLVAVDQEGGQVQSLSGPGFSAIPAALEQGGWSVAGLRERAAQWAAQLRSAGVNVDLAPVGDVVPARIGTANGPIGRYGRQFGATPDVVARQGAAFVQGFSRSGVLTTLKHFPGLGRVSGNTDTTEQVTDTTLTRDSADVASFRSGIVSGAGLVMVSLATYALIDPAHKAVFSPTVVTGMLRHDLGFQGVIVSDDLGKAASVRSVPPAQRAVSFLRAGGDLVLTVNNAVLPLMVEAVSYAARHDAAFRARTDASVRRVLTAKEAAGVLRCGS
ncbi:glycoside hydrolase family 3 protein [Streptomyces sp. NBC_01537]|uniref:glycoside hydrolase family 3 N-terminal domain-containing protein n=1 Tax=Streptomyces sp. NBC_01537 TaxID=2903896 RepID=UPI00386EBF26